MAKGQQFFICFFFLQKINKPANQNWPVIKRKEWFVLNELALLRNAISPESALVASWLHTDALELKVLWQYCYGRNRNSRKMPFPRMYTKATWWVQGGGFPVKSLQAWCETWNNWWRFHHRTTHAITTQRWHWWEPLVSAVWWPVWAETASEKHLFNNSVQCLTITVN